MIELAQKRVALANGIELDVVDMGPRDAEALIFLHGFPENHRTWRHQIAGHHDGRRRHLGDQRIADAAARRRAGAVKVVQLIIQQLRHRLVI